MISNGNRFLILERDRFTCQYCGRSAPEVTLEIDHIHPQSKGGKEISTNLITACRDCNSSKNNRIIKVGKVPKEIQLTENDYEPYRTYSIRMGQETWEKLKDKRKKSKLSWNLFLIELLKGEI